MIWWSKSLFLQGLTATVQPKADLRPLGTVLRATANFFFVRSGDLLFRSQPRGRIKKEGLAIMVGDRVGFQPLTGDPTTAVITAVMPRRNCLNRPAIANVDQAILVHSLRTPDLDYLLLDRFLLHVHSREPQLEILLCFNKVDLATAQQVEEVRRTYEPLGYRLAWTSARDGTGLDTVRRALADRTSVLAGPSGAGKSHLLAAIQPGLQLRYEAVSPRIGRGRHITRLVSLYTVQVPAGPGYVADTPGFSLLDLTHLFPWEVGPYYPEFQPFLHTCHYPRCLHGQEPLCGVKARVDQKSTRYRNYLRLVQELQEHHRSAGFVPRIEATIKHKDAAAGRKVRLPKLGLEARDPSRRRMRQELADYRQGEGAWGEEDSIPITDPPPGRSL